MVCGPAKGTAHQQIYNLSVGLEKCRREEDWVGAGGNTFLGSTGEQNNAEEKWIKEHCSRFCWLIFVSFHVFVLFITMNAFILPSIINNDLDTYSIYWSQTFTF